MTAQLLCAEQLPATKFHTYDGSAIDWKRNVLFWRSSDLCLHRCLSYLATKKESLDPGEITNELALLWRIARGR
jgi:hypothetical protein